APEGWNLVGPRGFRHSRQASLFQLLVDSKGGLVGPAHHRQPTQDARKCNERRHRSFLVVQTPLNAIVADVGAIRNRPLLDILAHLSAKNPNFAQSAGLSSADMSSSGRAESPPPNDIAPAPADFRPNRPDNSPVGGAIRGMSTFSP